MPVEEAFFEKRRVTRRDELRPRRWSKRHRGACFDVQDEAFQEKDGHMDESRSVKDGAEDTNERNVTSHSEMCEQSAEGCEVTSEEKGHDVKFENHAKESQEAKHKGASGCCGDSSGVERKGPQMPELRPYRQDQRSASLVNGMTRERFSKNGEIVVILKQSKDEMSADLTAFKKNGLDRKTNHQDLMKIETEEIFVLTKATVGALKLEQSVKEVAQPRATRPPLWRDTLQSRASCCRTEGAARQEVEKKLTAETEVQCCGLHPCTEAQGRNPRRGEEIPPLFGPPIQ